MTKVVLGSCRGRVVSKKWCKVNQIKRNLIPPDGVLKKLRVDFRSKCKKYGHFYSLKIKNDFLIKTKKAQTMKEKMNKFDNIKINKFCLLEDY